MILSSFNYYNHWNTLIESISLSQSGVELYRYKKAQLEELKLYCIQIYVM